ncbi:DUF932 domain-containing protein [Candidatus Riflebacteria bacterium]
MHCVETLGYVGQTPWHNLGQEISEEDARDWTKFLAASGLDWQVGLTDHYYKVADTCEDADIISGEMRLKKSLRKKTIIRLDKQLELGVASPNYTLYQNEEFFEFFNPFIEQGLAIYHTAGALKEGRKIFALCKILADPVEVVKDDPIDPYILLAGGHDGKTSNSVLYTDVRVVCQNTMLRALGDEERDILRVHHRGDMKGTMERVREIMDVANRNFQLTIQDYRFLAERKVGGLENLKKYLLRVMDKVEEFEETGKKPRNFDNILHLCEFSPGQQNPAMKDTYWQAFNGITNFVDFHRGQKSNRLHSAWFASGKTLKDRALKVALEMAA